MRIDKDTFREILDSITRNRSRSLLTGFGIFWGVFMLMLLVGGGAGLKQTISNEMEGFAHNSCIAFANNTSKAYKGFKKGRSWMMDYNDVERVKNMVPEVDIVSPILSYWRATFYHNEESFVGSVKGIRPDYAEIETPKMMYGRFINDNDLLSSRKVCVIGKEVYKTLFPEGGDPCGKSIKVSGVYYQVVGVNWSAGNININGSAESSIFIPINIARQVYNTGNDIHILFFTAKEGVAMSDIIPRVREVIGRRHYVDPTDEMGLIMLNTQLIFGLQDSLFKGVSFVIWLVGLGTLLAGAIGVSNIMMVSVKERTGEIGIRRAIGATPRMILSQIIAESITLTLVAGMMGIVIAALILAAVNMGMTEDGILKADYQVSFITAVSAALLLTVLGVAAGLAPAARAMGIKPVDAMHEE